MLPRIIHGFTLIEILVALLIFSIIGAISSQFTGQAVVLIEFCWRERGLILQPDQSHSITCVADLADRRVEAILDGGILEIEWRDDDHVTMTGPFATSFRGRVLV